MKPRNTVLNIITSAAIITWAAQCKSHDQQSKAYDTTEESSIEQIDSLDNLCTFTDSVKDDLIVCLETDGENSFTHTEALESIPDFSNTTLELPISQLSKSYNNKRHPLAVSWISRNFWSLLGRGWVEDSILVHQSKLAPRESNITSNTKYDVADTLSLPLIHPSLIWSFPDLLDDQLKEEWFQSYSNPDSLETNNNILYKWEKNISENLYKIGGHIYDIVVKKLPSWHCALAVYRNWKIFLASYVSVWVSSRKTKTWQFEIARKSPYYISYKYDSPMPFALCFDEQWWFFFHQWNVTWKPASHGCVRLPWAYASILYSLVHGKDHTDVFIDKNLYKTK